MLRYSLLSTLSNKHKLRSVRKTLYKYSKLVIATVKKGKEVSFLNSVEITNIVKSFLINPILNPYSTLDKPFRL